MMMQMLEAGGMQILTDSIRTANQDNPRGYYEFEPVKGLPKGNSDWVPLAQGKVVKVISALLEHLPANYDYKLVFMQRRIDEVIASQRRMQSHRGEPQSEISDEKLAGMLERHLTRVKAWLSLQPNITTVSIDYNQLVTDPLPHALAVNHLVGGRLDVQQMCAVVNPTLYRNRSPQ